LLMCEPRVEKIPVLRQPFDFKATYRLGERSLRVKSGSCPLSAGK
jgi:hypothetical protein